MDFVDKLPQFTNTRYTADNTTSVTGAETSTGTLYVDDQYLVFYSANKGFKIEYPHIIIHAISPDTYLYCQVSDGEEDFVELRFYLAEPHRLEDLFKCMSECAALHPDTTDSSDEEESIVQQLQSNDLSEYISSESQLSQLTPKGQRTLEHLESIIK